MYHLILEHADYAKHGPALYGVQCWHKPGAPDICVDANNGLWAVDNADDDCGMDAFSLIAYLLRSGVDKPQI